MTADEVRLLYSPIQIFGSTNMQEIEQGILELVGGFIGLAVGASVIYFIAVSSCQYWSHWCDLCCSCTSTELQSCSGW